MQHAWRSSSQQHARERVRAAAPCRHSAPIRSRTCLHASAQPRQQYTIGQDNLYELLGVPSSADAAAIKAAYRSLVKTSHPDLYQEPEEQAAAATKLVELNAALDVLSDPIQRQSYDAELALVQEAEAAYAAGHANHLTEVELQQLRDVMDRARTAMQRALQVRLQAREVERHAKTLRKAGKTKQKSQRTLTRRAQAATGDTAAGNQGAKTLPPSAAREAKQAAKEEQQRQRQERRHARKEATQARAQAQYAELQAAWLHLQVRQQTRPKSSNGVQVGASSDSSSDNDAASDPGGLDKLYDELALYGSASEMLRQVALGQDFGSIVAEQGKAGAPGTRRRSTTPLSRQWPGSEP